MPKLYERVSDDLLREHGFDPQWISEPESEGPFHACRITTECPHCGTSGFHGWTVLDLSTGSGGSQDWYGDNGECEAEETAGMLNAAWLAGRNYEKGREPA